MRIKDVFDYIAGKKQSRSGFKIDLTEIGTELRDLMRQSKSERLTAIFFDSYSADLYTILPSEKILNMTFGFNDDLNMVGKMLVECAKVKHEQVCKDRILEDGVEKKPANVMLYNTDTKEVVGGIAVHQEGKNQVAYVINEKKRQANIQAMKKDNVM